MDSRLDSISTRSSSRKGDKVIHMMRHGQTEMNLFLHYNADARNGLYDPQLYDTKLTQAGKRQATAAQSSVNLLNPSPQLLVVSPLSRALETAELAFRNATCERMVQPLARERLYYSSDVGLEPDKLQPKYPQYDMSNLDRIWWHSDGNGDPQSVEPEPSDTFIMRCLKLYQWLWTQPQSSIGLVSHHGVLLALTGIDFDNCQMISLNLSDFVIESYVQQLRDSPDGDANLPPALGGAIERPPSPRDAYAGKGGAPGTSNPIPSSGSMSMMSMHYGQNGHWDGQGNGYSGDDVEWDQYGGQYYHNAIDGLRGIGQHRWSFGGKGGVGGNPVIRSAANRRMFFSLGSESDPYQQQQREAGGYGGPTGWTHDPGHMQQHMLHAMNGSNGLTGMPRYSMPPPIAMSGPEWGMRGYVPHM